MAKEGIENVSQIIQNLKVILRQEAMKLGVEIEFRVAEINQYERLAFLSMAQESLKG